MKPCPCCGSPTPAPERINPIGTMGDFPRAIVLWNCPGAQEIDHSILRFGVIEKTPFTCNTTRATEWQRAEPRLRYRADMAQQVKLALDGMI